MDARVQKRMTLEVQLANIRVSIKDVRNYLESDLLSTYNPVEDFLSSAQASGMARIISVPWRVRCLPIILIGRTGLHLVPGDG